MLAIASFMGGIFLIIGALFLARGNVYISVGAYFLADVMWVLMALADRHWISASIIVFGMACGLYVWYRMHSGEFRKSIRKNDG